MSAINDGGPALPVLDDAGGGLYCRSGGLSLRDYFAAQALAGMASIALDDGDMLMGWEEMAKASYKAADAMLAARSAQP